MVLLILPLAAWAESNPAEQVQALLARPLNEAAAVRLALANNPGLKATYAELEVSQAEFLQGGLIENPKAGVHLGNSTGGRKELEISVAQDLMSLFTRPLRKKLGDKRFKRAQAETADAVFRLSVETTAAFYEYQAAEIGRALRQAVLETARAAEELAVRQFAAGTANALDKGEHQVRAERAQTEYLRAESEAAAARERLNALLGLRGPQATDWKAEAAIPSPAGDEPGLGAILLGASQRRYDLEAARLAVDIGEREKSLARFAAFTTLEAGFDWHREPEDDGSNRLAMGPSLEVGLPIFDRGQNARLGAKAQAEAAKHGLDALETQIEAEARSAHARMLAARKIAERYREVTIPVHEARTAEALKHYNFMLVGVYHLLEIKQDEIAAKREYAEALKDYWTARAELERAAGGRLPAAVKIEKQEAPKGGDDETHH